MHHMNKATTECQYNIIIVDISELILDTKISDEKTSTHL